MWRFYDDMTDGTVKQTQHMTGGTVKQTNHRETTKDDIQSCHWRLSLGVVYIQDCYGLLHNAKYV